MERFSTALNSGAPPDRLLKLPMTLGDWLEIQTYEKPGWGLRRVVTTEVRRQYASASPSQIGIAFALVGEKDLWKRVDTRRKVDKRASADALERIYERRNLIAHAGDRRGNGRATITVDEVEADLACVISIVDALDALT